MLLPVTTAFLIAGVVGVLLLLLVGGGALAFAGWGSGTGLLGGADPEPAPLSDTQEATSSLPEPTQEQTRSQEPAESTETASVSPNAPPDPAFDELLPTLEQRTDIPIMLPADLPGELENVAIRESRSGDTSADEYDILFLAEPPDGILEEYVGANDAGTLTASSNPQRSGSEFYDIVSVEELELPDGTDATLRYMEPDGGNYGPFWEGEFEKYGVVYTLTVPSQDPSGDAARQALSTMVEVRGALEEPDESSTESAEPENMSADPETEAREAAEDYYRAVGSEDWTYTHEHLDSETQAVFTEEEWFQKNQWFADRNPAIYHVLSVEEDENSTEPFVEVDLRLTGADGSASERTTYWVLENGEWLHRFSQEEIDLFMPGVPFEEFVAARQ